MARAINIGTLLVEREHSSVWTIHPLQSLCEAARSMTTHNVGALAVTDDDGDLVGIVSERDLTRAIGAYEDDLVNKPVSLVMTRGLVTCSANDDIGDVLALMRSNGIRHIPVVEGQHLFGMFSIRELSQAYEMVRIQADTDSLTGLPNRQCFINTLSIEIDRCTCYGGVVSLAMIDIDHFKQVNDKYGHAAGDKVLETFATIFVEQFRNVDWIGRMGGEEFSAVFPETDLDGATVSCERLLRMIRATKVQVGTNEICATVSIGLTQLSTPNTTAADFLKKADELLYRAKAGGRNRIEADYFHPENSNLSTKAAINS
jgi:diguanylate cyclase (GGDEF)-like protein